MLDIRDVVTTIEVIVQIITLSGGLTATAWWVYRYVIRKESIED